MLFCKAYVSQFMLLFYKLIFNNNNIFSNVKKKTKKQCDQGRTRCNKYTKQIYAEKRALQ